MEYVKRLLVVTLLLLGCDGGGELGGESDAGTDTRAAMVDSAPPALDTSPATDVLPPSSDVQPHTAGTTGGSAGAGGAGGTGGTVGPAGGNAGSSTPMAGAGGTPMDAGGTAGGGGTPAGGVGGAGGFEQPDPSMMYCPQHPGLTYTYCGHIGPYGEYDGVIGYRQVARYKSGYACGNCRAGNQPITGCLREKAPPPNSIGIDVPTLCVPSCGECCYREPAPCSSNADCCAPLICKSGRCG